MSIHATLVGRLGGDPELRSTRSGKTVLGFSVATDHGWGDNKQTLWVRVSVWGKRGETLSNHLKKGSSVLVSGQLTTSEFDRRDGGKGFSLELSADQVEFVGSRDSGGGNGDGNRGGGNRGGGGGGGGNRTSDYDDYGY